MYWTLDSVKYYSTNIFIYLLYKKNTNIEQENNIYINITYFYWYLFSQ